MFVGGFIGSPSMNFIDCRYLPADGALAGPTFQYRVPDPLRKGLQANGAVQVVLGVRPEDIGTRTESGCDGIPGTVYMLEPLGRENLLTIQVGDSMIKALAPPEVCVKLDQPVWLTPNENHVHIFDRKTEESLSDSPSPLSTTTAPHVILSDRRERRISILPEEQ
jgi:multiple sugar transport system ATP-binding protein